MRGRGRLAPAAVSRPLRPGGAPRRARSPCCRRGVRNGDVRGRRSRCGRSAPPARSEARLRSRRTSARSATACSPARSRSFRERRRCRCARSRPPGPAPSGRRPPSSFPAPISPRSREGGGCRTGVCSSSRTRRRHPGTSSRSSSSRGPSSSSAGSRGRRLSASRSRRSPAFRPRSSSSSVTGRSEPISSASRQPPRVLPASASSACEPVTRRCASSPAPRRDSSRATGRTCPIRRWRRCRSESRWFPPRSAVCPRS